MQYDELVKENARLQAEVEQWKANNMANARAAGELVKILRAEVSHHKTKRLRATQLAILKSQEMKAYRAEVGNLRDQRDALKPELAELNDEIIDHRNYTKACREEREAREAELTKARELTANLRTKKKWGVVVDEKVLIDLESMLSNQSAPADKGDDDWHMNPCKQGHRDVGAAGGVAHCYTCDEKIEAATTQEAYERWNAAHPAEQPESADKGQGEPVAWAMKPGLDRISVNPKASHAVFGHSGEPGWDVPLYAEPPAPVAVVMPEKYDDVLLPFLSLMRAELHANAHKGDRPGWLQMDRKTAVLEVFYHMGKLHQAVHRDEAEAIKEYAADVANMCMMLTDVCGYLNSEPKP